MKKILPKPSKLTILKFTFMTSIVFAALTGGYTFRENFTLQSPIVVKFQTPWKAIDKNQKVISPLSMNDQSYAEDNTAGDSARINPEEVDIFDSAAVQAYVHQEAVEKWGYKEAASLINLLNGESSYNPLAQNRTSTAFGLFQFLDATWENYGCKKTVDLKDQVECGFKYITARYETPSKAYRFWLAQSPNWY